MKAITTKFHGPTDIRGSRYSATDGDGNKITISAGNHAAAALALCAKMNWEGDLIEGGTKDGCVFVFADSPRITNPTVDKRRATRTVEQQNDFMGEVLGDI